MHRCSRSTERLGLFTAGAAATAAMAGVSRLHSPQVMPRLTDLLAATVADPGSNRGAAFGSAAQLLNGGLFAIGYVAAADRTGRRLGPGSGLVLGLLHGVAAGLLLGVTPALHPRVPERLPAPGAFMRRHGLDASLELVALHALYGTLVGTAAAWLRGRRSGTER